MIKKMLVSASLAGLLAFLLFAPITGLVLSGYTVELHWQRPLWLACGVFMGHFLLSFARDRLSSRAKNAAVHGRKKILTEGKNRHVPMFFGVLLLALLLPFFVGKYGLSIAILALIYILLALGLNIVVGLAGLLDLGFVAFYAVGAYGYRAFIGQ